MARFHRRDEGAAAVELALVLPILLLLIFGIIEFGFIFNIWNGITHSAREGARQMAVGVDADDAEDAALAASPDLNGVDNRVCTGTEVGDDVQMICTGDYNLSLWVFTKDLTLTSTAVMKQE